jgi:hypothetical protein
MLRSSYVRLGGPQHSVWMWHGKAFLTIPGNEHKASNSAPVTLTDMQTLIFRSSSFRVFFPLEYSGQRQKQTTHRRRRQKCMELYLYFPLLLLCSLMQNKRCISVWLVYEREVARNLAAESITKIWTDISFPVFCLSHFSVWPKNSMLLRVL